VEQAARANTAATRAMRFIDDLLRRGGVTGRCNSGDPGHTDGWLGSDWAARMWRDLRGLSRVEAH
jgi:hypothetical protein